MRNGWSNSNLYLDRLACSLNPHHLAFSYMEAVEQPLCFEKHWTLSGSESFTHII